MTSARIATLQRCRSCNGSGRKRSEPSLRCTGSGYLVVGSCNCGRLTKLGEDAEANAHTTASRPEAAQLDTRRDR
jgi:hypothetical protein